MKQPIAIVSLGYWIKLAVPLKDLSKISEMLTSYVQVESAYVDHKVAYYVAENQRTLSIEIADEVLDTKPEDPVKEEEKAA